MFKWRSPRCHLVVGRRTIRILTVRRMTQAVTATPPATTILVVEDEVSFVEALQIGLKREGFHVEVAMDVIAALERFDSVQPDLVVLDVMLPRMPGIDVCRELRSNARVP